MVGPNELLSRTTVAVDPKSGPDIIQMQHNWPHLYAEACVDVDDLAEEIGKAYGGFYDQSKGSCLVNGQWKAVPHQLIGVAHAYREDRFKESGIETFPDTWEEYKEAGKKLKARGRPFGQTFAHERLFMTNSSMDLKAYMARWQGLIDKALETYLPKESRYPYVIHQAMRYSVFAGGKRLRPILTLAAAEAVGGDPESVLFAGCAIELIHTYSLIHDDLPAMDNDDLRRNKPTNHKVFGENMAILAGDALLTLAFEVLSRPENLKNFKAEVILSIIQEIAMAAGTLGMIGGQVMDILCEGRRELDSNTLEYIHTHKTGKLLLASLRTGALLAGATAEQLRAITEYGTCIGLCFQIVDDILDIEGTTEEIGKDAGSDAERDKATYPALYGLDASKKLARELATKAIQALTGFGESAQPLRRIGDFIVSRTY